jgi:hypothetical protein
MSASALLYEVAQPSAVLLVSLTRIVHPVKIKQAENYGPGKIKFLQFWELVAEKIIEKNNCVSPFGRSHFPRAFGRRLQAENKKAIIPEP